MMHKTLLFPIVLLFRAANSQASLFELSNQETIDISEGPSSTTLIEFESIDGQDSSVLSTDTYSGDIELIVKIDVRVDDGEDHQPQIVLFVAPEDTTVEDVTTNDKDWAGFEERVVSWMKESICSEMDHTWFNFNTKQEGGTYITQSHEMKEEKLSCGASLKLSKDKDMVSASYSLDYDHETGDGSWIQIGSDVPLPSEYRSAPLKLGYRIKRGNKSGYFVSTTSKIVRIEEATTIKETIGSIVSNLRGGTKRIQ
jgi:hypothetical protein